MHKTTQLKEKCQTMNDQIKSRQNKSNLSFAFRVTITLICFCYCQLDFFHSNTHNSCMLCYIICFFLGPKFGCSKCCLVEGLFQLSQQGLFWPKHFTEWRLRGAKNRRELPWIGMKSTSLKTSRLKT